MINATKFGPGTFKLGTTPGTDFSCQVQSMTFEPDKDEGDPINTLCGDSVPGSINYTYKLTGTFVQDLAVTAGLVEYAWTNKGTVQDFEFVPNTAAVAKMAGKVVVDPLAIGGEEYGAIMTSDFEWSIVGTPTPTFHTGSMTTFEATANIPVTVGYPEAVSA